MSGGLFQIAMVDRQSVRSPFLREGRSRKSGHTCTVCGAVFGLWASLAEHKEVHYNDRKSLSSQQGKPEKRTPKSKKFSGKEQLSGKKETTSDGFGKRQIIDHLKFSRVTNAFSTGCPETNISRQYDMKASVGQCSSSTLNNCSKFSGQETELESNAAKRTRNNLTKMSLKNTGNCRPPLSVDCSDIIITNIRSKCKRKFISERKEAIESLSSERDVINADKHETNSGTEEKLPYLSEKAIEIVDIKSSLLNKNQHDYSKGSVHEYDSNTIEGGRMDQTFSRAEVSCVNQAEVNHLFDAPHRKTSKSKSHGSPEDTVLLVKEDFVWQTVSIMEAAVQQNEVDCNVCSEMSFTINSEELLDVEEEVVCTEGNNLEPALSGNSHRNHKTTTPVKCFPPLIVSSDASNVPTNKNSCGGSNLVILLKPEESHSSDKSGIQMVSLLKSNPNSKQTCSAEESCQVASTTTDSFLVQNKIEETEVADSILPLSSQFVLVKKMNQSGLGRPVPQKQMISLLKPHQNHVEIADEHREENKSQQSHNRNSRPSHSPEQSAVRLEMVGTEATVVEAAARLKSKSVTAKERLNIKSCNDACSVASVPSCTSSPIVSTDFVVTQRTSPVFSEEIQCSFTPHDVLAKRCDKQLMDETFGIQMQHPNINGVKKEITGLEAAADSKHSVEISAKYLEVGKSNLSREFLSAEVTQQQRVTALEPGKTEHCTDTKDSLEDSYDCVLCSEKFSSPVELDVHRKSQHLCLKCNRVFRQTSNLRKHLRVNHESYRPHRCETCGKCFPFLSSLKEHRVVHSRTALERVHTCEVCGKAFTRASGLRKHSKEEHLDVKPYVCVLCHKSFAYLCSLRSHMHAHSSERPFSCDACDQTFKQSSNLRKHVRLHHRPKCNQCEGSCICDPQTDKVAGCGGKSTICEVCGRTCEGQKQLTIHMRVHTGEKPEVCDVCGKSFQHKSNLLKHQLKHSGTKAFACKFCGRAFYANHSLLSHMRLHTGESPFQCDACGKRFCTKNGLQVHSLLHSNMRPFACSTCGKTFTQLGNLNKHVALHTGERPFVCAYCDKGFVDSSALKRHALKHTIELTLDCSTCGKRFQHLPALQSHELLHASEQKSEYSGGQELERLVCVVCSKSFVHRSNYLRHVKRHRGEHDDDEVDEVVLNPGEYIVCLTE